MNIGENADNVVQWTKPTLEHLVDTDKLVVNCTILLDNDLFLTDASIDDLYEIEDDRIIVIENTRQFLFDEQLQDKMDYLIEEDVQAILLKHKINGTVKFGQLNKDGFAFWGYQFDCGKLQKLIGSVIFEVDYGQYK